MIPIVTEIPANHIFLETIPGKGIHRLVLESAEYNGQQYVMAFYCNQKLLGKILKDIAKAVIAGKEQDVEAIDAPEDRSAVQSGQEDISKD